MLVFRLHLLHWELAFCRLYYPMAACLLGLLDGSPAAADLHLSIVYQGKKQGLSKSFQPFSSSPVLLSLPILLN